MVVTGLEPYVALNTRLRSTYVFSASAFLTHHLEDLKSRLTALRAAGVALGFGNPLKAIWAAVPFSFVIDWVTSVSSVLDDFGTTVIADGDFWVRRPVSSLLITGDIGLAQFTYYHPTLGWSFPLDMGRAKVRRYIRWVGPPVSGDYITTFSGLTAKQASLLLAISAGTSY